VERPRGENRRRHFRIDWKPERVQMGDGFGGKTVVVVSGSGERARAEEGGIATTVVAESFYELREKMKEEF